MKTLSTKLTHTKILLHCHSICILLKTALRYSDTEHDGIHIRHDLGMTIEMQGRDDVLTSSRRSIHDYDYYVAK